MRAHTLALSLLMKRRSWATIPRTVRTTCPNLTLDEPPAESWRDASGQTGPPQSPTLCLPALPDHPVVLRAVKVF